MHDPEDKELRRRLAEAVHNLGAVRMDLNELDLAEESLRESLDLRRQLIADFPNLPQYKASTSKTLRNLGVLNTKRKRWEDARGFLGDAVEISREAIQQAPGRSVFLRDLRQHALHLNRVLRRLFLHEDLIALTLIMEECLSGSPRWIHDAGVYTCHAIPLLDQDSSLSDDEREILRQSYGARSVELMTLAYERGFLGLDPDHREYAPLRERSDFRALSESVTESKQLAKGK